VENIELSVYVTEHLNINNGLDASNKVTFFTVNAFVVGSIKILSLAIDAYAAEALLFHYHSITTPLVFTDKGFPA
jgi:hypothetical protein